MDPAVKKRTQRSIPLHVKLKILEEVEKKTFSKSQIADIYNIPRSTLSTIIKNKEKIDRAVAAGSKTESRKRLRKGTHVELEEKLLEWFQYMKNINVSISGSMIQEKAREICKLLDIKDFDCSSGWLWRFQQRNIAYEGSCEEIMKSDQLETNEWLKYFAHLKSSYSDSDIFNLDETGVFFNLLPDQSLDSNNGCVNSETLTVVVCCNADGSEKLRLWIIGKYKDPYSNKTADGLDLSFDYSHQKNAWIDSTLFREWLIKFQRRMAAQNRKVILTIDNCTAHKIDGMDLPNVRVVFFPLAATQRIQPLNQGIIDHLKRSFKLRLVRFTILSIESKQISPRWSSLQAMKALAASWDSITSHIIKTSFEKAWNLNISQNGFNIDFDEPEEWKILKHIVSSENVSFSDFVQIDDDLTTCSQSDVESLFGSDDEETVPIIEELVTKPSKNELFSALSVIHCFTQVTPELDLSFINSLEKVTKDCISYSQRTKHK